MAEYRQQTRKLGEYSRQVTLMKSGSSDRDGSRMPPVMARRIEQGWTAKHVEHEVLLKRRSALCDERMGIEAGNGVSRFHWQTPYRWIALRSIQCHSQ